MSTQTIDTSAIAARIADLTARKTALEDEINAIKTRLRTELGDTYKDDHVTISTNRRFSAIQAQAWLEANPAFAPLVTETVISSTLAKKNLPPTIYEALMIPVGEPIVRIR